MSVWWMFRSVKRLKVMIWKSTVNGSWWFSSSARSRLHVHMDTITTIWTERYMLRVFVMNIHHSQTYTRTAAAAADGGTWTYFCSLEGGNYWTTKTGSGFHWPAEHTLDPTHPSSCLLFTFHIFGVWDFPCQSVWALSASNTKWLAHSLVVTTVWCVTLKIIRIFRYIRGTHIN